MPFIGVGCGARAEDEASPRYSVILSLFGGGGLVEESSFAWMDEDDDDNESVEDAGKEEDDDEEDCAGDDPSRLALSSIPNTSPCSLSTKYTPSISTRLAWIWCLLPLILLCSLLFSFKILINFLKK